MNSNTLQTVNLPECISSCVALASPFELTFGHSFKDVVINYSFYGDINKPTVVILGGISASQYVADTNIEGIFVKGWWDPLVGYEKAVDLRHYSVLSIDYFDGLNGLNKDSSQTPFISTFDQASAIKQVIEQLDIFKVAAIIGSSYGGMVALAFAQKFPEHLEKVITICAGNGSDSRNTALRHLQRSILQLSLESGQANRGLELARSLAMLGYRGANELQQRFPNEIQVEEKQASFPILSYLENQGKKFAGRFNPQRFINLSLSVDLHQINPENINVDCLLIGIEGDLIVAPEQIQALAKEIGHHAQFSSITSDVGHDGFLKEFGQIAALIQTQLGPR